MTLKIETTAGGDTTKLRLIGRVDGEHLAELRAQVRRHRPRIVLDLEEVTLVDVSVVRFFNDCEALGIELINCAPYIRVWMKGERP